MGRGSSENEIPSSAPRFHYAGSFGAEDTIFRSLWTYPSLYISRSQVIEHLVNGYGTGYEWHNGQLVDETNGYYDEEEDVWRLRPDPAPLVAREDVWKPHDEEDWEDRMSPEERERLFGSPLTYRERARLRAIHRRDHIDQAMVTRTSVPSHPMSQYSAINNIPADVTPDWAAVCWEAVDLIENMAPLDGYQLRNMGDFTDRNKEYARQAAERLESLGFSRPAPVVYGEIVEPREIREPELEEIELSPEVREELGKLLDGLTSA
jgi:hypothetical protein